MVSIFFWNFNWTPPNKKPWFINLGSGGCPIPPPLKLSLHWVNLLGLVWVGVVVSNKFSFNLHFFSDAFLSDLFWKFTWRYAGNLKSLIGESSSIIMPSIPVSGSLPLNSEGIGGKQNESAGQRGVFNHYGGIPPQRSPPPTLSGHWQTGKP